MRLHNPNQVNDGGAIILILAVIVIIVSGIGGCMRFWPEYVVWRNEMDGRAELAKADQNRNIAVATARAAAEAAKLQGEAEITRAKAAAAANEIMARSLGGPENYLRWKYINMLESTGANTNREVIYLPGNIMPLQEATRLSERPRPQEMKASEEK